MSFDPTLPKPNSQVSSAELRDQFNGLKQQLNEAYTYVDDQIQRTTAYTMNEVEQLSVTVSNPPTQAEVQAIADKLNELMTCLRRP